MDYQSFLGLWERAAGEASLSAYVEAESASAGAGGLAQTVAILTAIHGMAHGDVRAIRGATGLSQGRFCETYGIPAGTLRKWEEGTREAPVWARMLLSYAVAMDAAGRIS